MMRYPRRMQWVMVRVRGAVAAAYYKVVAEPERDWVRVTARPRTPPNEEL